METQVGGEDIRQAEKVCLKRKLTGPPRLLLLGKTRTRSVREDRSEVRDKPDGFSLKSSAAAAAESDAADVEEEASPVCDVTGESADVTDRKLKRRRWWRLLLCFRTKSSKKQRSDEFPPAEGALQEAEAVDTEEKKTTFKRFLTSANARRAAEQRDEKPSATLRKKLRLFLSRSSPTNEDVAAGDEPAGLETATTDPGQEVVTSIAEINVQPSEDTTSPDEPLTEERRVSVAAATDQSEIVQTDPANANELPVDLNEVDEVSCDAAELESDEEAQPMNNGPAVILNSSIRIQLVPPDDITEQEEEEEFWEGNQNHLLLLFGFHHSELQLLQAARSVVRAAMNAAVDQLSREQLREPLGCRDA
ncbi:uncharacterized protein LOC133997255 [Scomber scombrus]|uniref:uncharacterized protein LOC133997255 n=1 Tax=Scomber scombrus TaxID=13677 RepID=UPI002DD97C27|nr:uncharacterized protein LOC133997255 [Scomber scombrus]